MEVLEESLPQESTEHDERPSVSMLHEAILVGVCCMAQLITQACLAQSIAPLLIISNGLGGSAFQYRSWMPAAYSLTVGTFILPAGRLGDVLGHREVFICGWLWLALWSTVLGFSVYSGQILLDFCRAMQGIGPAFLLPNALAILGRTYPPGKRKDMVFSLFGSTAPSGFLIGAVFSSMLGQLAWWPWAFWCTAILAVLMAAASVLVIKPAPPHEPDQGQASVVQRLDLPGTVVGIAALVLFNFAWNQAPIVGWNTVYVYVLLIVGIALAAAFLFLEHRVPYPLLDVKALTSESGFVLACVAVGWSAFGIWLYYLWEFMLILRHETPLQASAYFVPVACSGFGAALVTGKLLSVVPPGVVMLISMTAFTTGTVVLATLPVERVYWAGIFISCLIMPWGMDMSFPSGCIILSNSMPPEKQGMAASLVNTAVNYSISLGLGIAGTVEVHVNHGGSTTLEGYRGAWYLGIGLGSCGIALSCLFLYTSLSKRSVRH